MAVDIQYKRTCSSVNDHFKMRVFSVLFGLFVLGQSVPVTLYRETSPGVWIGENVTDALTELQVSEDDIAIYFRNQDSGDKVIIVHPDDPSSAKSNGFSSDKDTMFIVHGWQNRFDSPICETIADAVLQIKDLNVFIVDWNKLAKESYDIAQSAVPSLGNLLGTLITNLVENNGLSLERTTIVGHSLGAHVAGRAGAALDGKVAQIVGLDPALPLFSYDDTTTRLDTTDAQFVEVIHTCPGILGFDKDLGHADYWPNGGKNQPGCVLDYTGACAHGRAFFYYAESLLSGGFLARQCDSYENYKNNECDNAATSTMGEYNLDKSASGRFYLTTNSASPYARN